MDHGAHVRSRRQLRTGRSEDTENEPVNVIQPFKRQISKLSTMAKATQAASGSRQ